ncbi:MAG: beta-lactamase family protein [Acidobacteria bacterium]|nr:beta-lactamase family protein [Acidobacteriota bacterium]
MIARLLVVVLAVIVTVSSTAAQTGRAAVDAVLSGAVARGEIPGVVAMAATRTGAIYEGAFGVADLPSRTPLQTGAIFRIASMTKPITSVALMQLVEAGRLRLDDSASKYLPELADVKVFERFDARTGTYTLRPAKKTITVRHLLTHTAGFGYNFTNPIVRDFKPREGEQYAAGPLVFEPGERWLYGTNTDWVGRLVEAISGQRLETYFREHIFMPLGMRETFYNVPEDTRARVVTVHRRAGETSFTVESVQPPFTSPRPIGGGGLHSTAADYTRFMRMLLGGGALDGARVLKAETVALMGQNHLGNLGVPALKTAMPDRSADWTTLVNDGRDRWGLGFLIATAPPPGKRSPGSLSWGGINNTYFWVDPARGIAGVILMQFLPFADPRALAVHDAFERAIYQLAGSSRS